MQMLIELLTCGGCLLFRLAVTTYFGDGDGDVCRFFIFNIFALSPKNPKHSLTIKIRLNQPTNFKIFLNYY